MYSITLPNYLCNDVFDLYETIQTLKTFLTDLFVSIILSIPTEYLDKICDNFQKSENLVTNCAIFFGDKEWLIVFFLIFRCMIGKSRMKGEKVVTNLVPYGPEKPRAGMVKMAATDQAISFTKKNVHKCYNTKTWKVLLNRPHSKKCKHDAIVASGLRKCAKKY